MTESKSWFSRQVEAELVGLKDAIPSSERVMDIAIIVFSFLIGLYFVAHQTWSTGFFTATFGTLEMLMIYGSLVFWIVSAGLEGVFGRRLLSRLFDVFG